MKRKYCVLIALGLLSFFSCDNLEHNTDKGNNIATETKQLSAESEPQKENQRREPHQYGGWYCPDNLNGFPVVDFLKQSNSQLNQNHKKKMKDANLISMGVGIVLTIYMGFLLLISQIGQMCQSLMGEWQLRKIHGMAHH